MFVLVKLDRLNAGANQESVLHIVPVRCAMLGRMKSEYALTLDSLHSFLQARRKREEMRRGPI